MRKTCALLLQADHDNFASKLHDWVNRGFRELGDYAGLGQGALTTKVVSHPDYLKDPIGVCLFNHKYPSFF